MIDKRKKDKFGNGLIAFLFICIIFLLCYAFKNPILLYSSNPEVEINHEYDPKKNIQQVFFHLDSDVKISGNININKITVDIKYLYLKSIGWKFNLLAEQYLFIFENTFFCSIFFSLLMKANE